jgi:hypothetical protein
MAEPIDVAESTLAEALAQFQQDNSSAIFFWRHDECV